MTTDDQSPKRPRGRPRKPLDPNAPPKRPRGRPAKAEEDKKAIHVPLRFTPAEHEVLHQAADDAGVPLTEFIMGIVWEKLRRKGIRP